MSVAIKFDFCVYRPMSNCKQISHTKTETHADQTQKLTARQLDKKKNQTKPQTTDTLIDNSIGRSWPAAISPNRVRNALSMCLWLSPTETMSTHGRSQQAKKKEKADININSPVNPESSRSRGGSIRAIRDIDEECELLVSMSDSKACFSPPDVRTLHASTRRRPQCILLYGPCQPI